MSLLRFLSNFLMSGVTKLEGGGAFTDSYAALRAVMVQQFMRNGIKQVKSALYIITFDYIVPIATTIKIRDKGCVLGGCMGAILEFSFQTTTTGWLNHNY